MSRGTAPPRCPQGGYFSLIIDGILNKDFLILVINCPALISHYYSFLNLLFLTQLNTHLFGLCPNMYIMCVISMPRTLRKMVTILYIFYTMYYNIIYISKSEFYLTFKYLKVVVEGQNVTVERQKCVWESVTRNLSCCVTLENHYHSLGLSLLAYTMNGWGIPPKSSAVYVDDHSQSRPIVSDTCNL